ncbi:MAG: deoxyribodipyrimidine photo-lyase [Parvibaculum sp.]
MPTIFWFRRDLRLADNPALIAACETGSEVIPLYILDPAEVANKGPIGGASSWWLHESLSELARTCAALGAPLVLRRGQPAKVLKSLVKETGADTICWNRCYEPHAIARDKQLKAELIDAGVTVQSFNAALLAEPWTIRNGSGEPYKVFTPFWRALSQLAPFAAPLRAPKALKPFAKALASDNLDDWHLQPTAPDWAGGLRATWKPGERAAATRLHDFLDVDVATYKDRRDFLSDNATSNLAPYLHWGEISPRQVWHTAAMRADADPASASGVAAFQRQLAWREFSAHLLFHWPDLVTHAWKPAYEKFPWANSKPHFRAWTRGQTGYPVVDAAMRALWTTGAMHNRARMIVASFLIKHLLIDWRQGADWFEDTLVDADLANNRAGWQWAAGSGADAAPYFRIFNPVLQGEKFDPSGAFVRQWVPELAGLDSRYIHKPWLAPQTALAEAGVALGETYPHPIVDHDKARARALAAYEEIKS